MLCVDRLLCLASKRAPSSPAVRQAVSLSESLGGALHVMPFEEGADPDEIRQTLSRGAAEADATMVDILPSPGNAGESVAAIKDYVRENEIDLVVTDTPTIRGPVPPLADSFVGTLLKELDTPVYVVGRSSDSETIRRILVPTDLSDPSLVALKHATGLASMYGASIVLLHVIDTSPYVALTTADRLSLRGTTLPEHRARRHLQHFVKAEGLEDVPVHSHLTFGEPANQICHFVDQEKLDLVVLSSHGATSSGEPFGAVAERVLRRIHVPLFLLKSFGRSLLSENGGPNSRSGVKTGS